MHMRNSYSVIGITAGLIFSSSLALAQVFSPPPHQPAPAQIPIQPGHVPGQPGMPQQFGRPPGALSTSISFIDILGGPTKLFIQLNNMWSPFDTNFSLGPGIAGRIALEKDTYGLGNGEKAYIHIKGGCNPPLMTTEGAELRLQFVCPAIQFKTYYKNYTPEGDSALSDLVAENVLVDAFISPTLNEWRYPTFNSIRVAVTGTVKEAKTCTHFFQIIFPVNICTAAAEYFNQIQPALANGIRDVAGQPQIRAQFEQQVFQIVRFYLLKKADINPRSPAQVEIIEAEFRGTDYLVTYLIR